MKTSFASADQETVPTAAAEETQNAVTTLVPVAPTEIVADSYFSNEGVEGDFDKSDIKMPRISLVQSVGPLSGELGYAPGVFVFNKEVIVGDVVKNPAGTVIGTENLIMTVFNLRKFFIEDLPYGTETIPAFFKTQEDARRAGFLPSADKRTMGEDHRYVKPVVDADVLIQGKAGDDRFVGFPLDFNGVPYAAARWTLQSTAYGRVGKQFFTDSQFALKHCGLLGKFYTVSSKRELLGKNWVFTPKATLKGVNSPEFIAWANNAVRA